MQTFFYILLTLLAINALLLLFSVNRTVKISKKEQKKPMPIMKPVREYQRSYRKAEPKDISVFKKIKNLTQKIKEQQQKREQEQINEGLKVS